MKEYEGTNPKNEATKPTKKTKTIEFFV